MRIKAGQFLISVFLILSSSAHAQPRPVKHFEHSDFSTEDSLHLLNEFGKYKNTDSTVCIANTCCVVVFPGTKEYTH